MLHLLWSSSMCLSELLSEQHSEQLSEDALELLSEVSWVLFVLFCLILGIHIVAAGSEILVPITNRRAARRTRRRAATRRAARSQQLSPRSSRRSRSRSASSSNRRLLLRELRQIEAFGDLEALAASDHVIEIIRVLRSSRQPFGYLSGMLLQKLRETTIYNRFLEQHSGSSSGGQPAESSEASEQLSETASELSVSLLDQVSEDAFEAIDDEARED